MNKPEIIELMNRMRNANARFDALRKAHNADEVAALKRLVLEGAAQYMSAEQMAEETGATVRRIRIVMRVLNLDPRRKPSVLSKHAATVLEENATLLGIEPAEMDFMSPLAYLPMGEEMRKQINAQAAQGVTEIEDDSVLIRIDRQTWEEHVENGECPISSACCGCHLDGAWVAE